ncbi:flagellar type III secretion system protein FlhB [Novosphingobium sp.]|uniref:EscU/YscU/HrcU family type III secretion system export apparatus switch protein n=1 Tax=Novosphingobium sp. TaxID=1874826 RepID=UPI00286DCF84|nr:flagellar type III secretion system protein FlhB [Novosphingobium sp.]
MSESAGEKNHAPTQKRKRDAAQKGDVLRSRDLATAVAAMAGAAWLVMAGPWLFKVLADGMVSGLSFSAADLRDFAPAGLMIRALIAIAPPVLVLGALVLVVSIASQLGFGEGRWVGSNALPKASRINPLNGLKRMFGAQALVELGKSMAKAGLLGAITWYWARSHWDLIRGLPGLSLHGKLAEGWDALTSLLFALSAGLVVIALIDFPIQLLRRLGRLKMSDQDMRDEHKEQEGAPEKKQAIRQRQRQLARGGVARAMTDAQFVVTNPTHFSVALAYDPLKASAPIVVAKGRGEKALAIRELAAELELPCLEIPALARSVYFTTRENQVIREELYGAVASVLAFVFALRRGERPPLPPIEVPVALRFDADGQLATA